MTLANVTSFHNFSLLNSEKKCKEGGIKSNTSRKFDAALPWKK